MSGNIEYQVNRSSVAQVQEHLWRCDADFIPPLSGRVSIENYAGKIADRATRFEAWHEGALVGLVAAYCNDTEARVAYITSVSVVREWKSYGIAANLLSQCLDYARNLGMSQVSLEVGDSNVPAIRLYEKSGFVAVETNPPFIRMDKQL